MTTDLKLDDIRLAYTEDILQRKLEVLRTARLDMQAKGLQGQVGVIGKDIALYIDKMKRRKHWPEHLVALALEYLVTNYCDTIYEVGAAADAEGAGE